LSRIFKPEARKIFGISYLPNKTPHREEEIKLLFRWIKSGIDTDTYRIPVIYGPSGTGKTMVVRKTLDKLKSIYKGDIEINIINSLAANTTYSALKNIGKMITDIPERGLSISEIIRRVYDVLSMRNIRYIVALDDADELIRKEEGRIIEILTRIEEEYNMRLIYPVIILRNLHPIIGLAGHIKSKIGGLTLEFKPYNWRELKDIIQERIELGFYPDSISINAIDLAAYISDYIYGGNAREMINLIFRGGIIAETHHDTKVICEHIRQAFYWGHSRSLAPDLKKEQVELIIAVAKAFKYNMDQYKLDRKIIKKSFQEYREISKKIITLKEYEDILKKELYEKRRILYKNENGEYIFFFYPVTHILAS